MVGADDYSRAAIGVGSDPEASFGIRPWCTRSGSSGRPKTVTSVAMTAAATPIRSALAMAMLNASWKPVTMFGM